MANLRTAFKSPTTKLGAYGVVLGLMLGGGAFIGSTVGPEPSASDPAGHGSEHSDGPVVTTADPAMTDEAVPGGLAVSRDGYTLVLLTPIVEPEAPAELALVIEGPDGQPLTDYTVEQDKELHRVVVSRDLATYAHVHPSRDGDGRWSVTAPALPPGSYRVFADFVPAGGDGLTLGADLTVPGDHEPTALPPPSAEVSVDDYIVSFDGELVAGVDSELTLEVTRDGRAVTDLQPYLDALGHLVAIRDGDLAYLHVHPLDETDGPGGPRVRFAVDVPTPGAYRLFFDFSHGDEVRTASATFVAEAKPSPSPSDPSAAPATSAPSASSEPAGGHDAHED